MSYSNVNPAPNMWPTATSPAYSPNAAPGPMYTSPAYMGPNAPPPMYTSPAYYAGPAVTGCSSAGIILVLFILLIIISRSWAI